MVVGLRQDGAEGEVGGVGGYLKWARKRWKSKEHLFGNQHSDLVKCFLVSWLPLELGRG